MLTLARAAKDLASHLPRPWERYLKPHNDKIVTPSTVQRDFQTIISEIGKPGYSPKPNRKFTRSGDWSNSTKTTIASCGQEAVKINT